MELIPVNKLSEIPTPNIRLYTLTDHDTIDDAVMRYKKFYGVEPVIGWTWREYVYFEIPEE